MHEWSSNLSQLFTSNKAFPSLTARVRFLAVNIWRKC
jgi:hypothetical protein